MPILKEYEQLKKSDICCDLAGLEKYIKKNNLSNALKITPSGINANYHVGVIKYKKFQLQILPKLINQEEDNDNQILKNLVFMLSYTKKLEIKTTNNALLDSDRNPFLEILIKEFAVSLFDALKRLSPKNYVREEDNLNYLKGKIVFSENIRYNNVNQSKFYCQYDDFSENNTLNQLFLFVSDCLYQISSNRENKRILKLIINYFADVQKVRFDRFSCEKIQLTRNQVLFKKPFNLAKMFIEHSSIDLSKNSFENISLIWDMNKLFEEFIFEVLRKNNTDANWIFTAQKGKRLLHSDNNKIRNTYVDIFAENKENKIIIDTKYKKFENTADFSNADVFQVSTYCLLHNTSHAVLLYPQWGKDKPDIPGYYLNTDSEKIRIYFKTINLKYKDLKNSISDIKRELNEIISSC